MPGKAVPVQADLLSWAIVDAGFDVDHVAESLGIDRPVVRAWMRGDAAPLTGQFRKLAKLLNRPPSFLLQSAPPEGVGTPAKFRRHASFGEPEPLYAEEVKAL